MLEILDSVTAILPWDPRDLGSRTEKILLDPEDPRSNLIRFQPHIDSTILCWLENKFTLLVPPRVFHYRCVVHGMWLKGNECTLDHFIKHDGLRLQKYINLAAKRTWITKCSEYAQNLISEAWYFSTKFAFVSFFAVRPWGPWLLVICCWILWILYFEHLFCFEILQIPDI